MKTRLIATAIAASITSLSNAQVYTISSNITKAEFWGQGYFILPSPGSVPPSLVLGGTAVDANSDGIIDSSNVSLTGATQFYFFSGWPPAPYVIRAIFALDNGNYTPASGVTFTSGTIAIDVWTTSSGWLPYSTIDASITNLPFIAGQVAGWGGSYTTAGLLLVPGSNPLPGAFTPPSSGFNDSVWAVNMIGTPSSLYLEGTVSLTP